MFYGHEIRPSYFSLNEDCFTINHHSISATFLNSKISAKLTAGNEMHLSYGYSKCKNGVCLGTINPLWIT